MARNKCTPLLVLTLILACCCVCDTKNRPNIVLLLTDDQDLMLGGGFALPGQRKATALPKTQKVLVEQGLTATNFFVHTPICCPSRSELLTGRYFHNIKARPSLDSAGVCMHVNETLVHNHTFAKHLQRVGYSVGLFGKYLNKMPRFVPEGFDAWFANGGGDYHNPEFETRGVPGIPNGLFRTEQYSTSAIGNYSIRWIRNVAHKTPFFAYISPKAAHEPFNPASWYEDYWDKDWPKHEPRPPNYNATPASRENHHGNIASQPMLTPEAARVVTDVFKNRWRTLMSVDDLVYDVIREIKELGLHNNTYFVYTSDHGFQLGQFNLLMDKRHVYDWNTRVPFVISGPGIPKGETVDFPATQVDLAPTFMDMAGVKVESESCDGRSLLPLLRTSSPDASFTSRWLELQPTKPIGSQRWRTSVFFEYYFNNANTKCVHNCNITNRASAPGLIRDASCGVISTAKGCWCNPLKDKNASNCYITEDQANNYIAVRTFGSDGELLYAEFATGDQSKLDINFNQVDFVEIYNTSNDTWLMHNLRDSMPEDTKLRLRSLLRSWYACKGSTCN